MSGGLREGIRDDGTVEGYVVETHHLPLESASVDAGGFFRIVGDGGPINYEIRVPMGPIKSAILTLPEKAGPDSQGGTSEIREPLEQIRELTRAIPLDRRVAEVLDEIDGLAAKAIALMGDVDRKTR